MVTVVSNWRGEYETVFLLFPHIAGGTFPFLPPPRPNYLGRERPNRAPDITSIVDLRRLFPGFISTTLETELARKHSDRGIRAHDPRIFRRGRVFHVGQLHFQRDLLFAHR